MENMETMKDIKIIEDKESMESIEATKGMLRLTFDQSTGLPEVSQSDANIRVLSREEHVFRLDIPMHVPVVVHVMDG